MWELTNSCYYWCNLEVSRHLYRSCICRRCPPPGWGGSSCAGARRGPRGPASGRSPGCRRYKVQVNSVKAYHPNNHCIATLLCKTPHYHTTLLQIRHNLCLRLLELSPTRLATPPFVISHFTKVLFLTRKFHPCLFFSTPVYFIVSKVCIWW